MRLFTTSANFRSRGAAALALIIVVETVFPTASLALTSGPAAPEFSSFEPVATTNMVNEFSGDFTYNIPVLNIPGANGGGYAMSLAYHSGETVETEASWVGYGWTLNPGAIMRTKKGFADDTKSIQTIHNDVPKNWTISGGGSAGNLEIYSTTIPVSVNANLRYNNYKGFGYTVGAGISVKGIVSLGYSLSDGGSSFSASVNPGAILTNIKKKKDKQDNDKAVASAITKYAVDGDVKALKSSLDKATANRAKAAKQGAKGAGALGALGSIASAYGMHSLADIQAPTNVTPYNGLSFNLAANLEVDPGPLEFGITLGVNGNYTQQENVKTRDVKGYGYMYSAEAYNDASAMMDYYTEKDSPYNKRDRYLSIPFSNADEFSVTGEGMSGGFRLYNRNAGRFRPNAVESDTKIGQIAFQANVGLDYGAGLTVGAGLQTLKVSGDDWGNSGSNSAFDNYKFTSVGDEPYFMRFSNDLGGSVDYDLSSGATTNALVTATVNELSSTPGAKSCEPVLNSTMQNTSLTSTIDGNIARSGRSSYIAYHTNAEMTTQSPSGKLVYAYDKSNSTNTLVTTARATYTGQIGEIATINEEGNTYIYGLPVYSGNEKNMQYDMQGLAAGNVQNRFISYKNTGGSNKMTVGSETGEPYASSFLLTQITTPDYVDRTLNGPSLDDFGGYTRFVYKKTQSAYHWRMPYTGFYYNSNDLSDPLDDVGSYSSGDKDVYYLDTIVTKTHVAVFKRSDRTDGLEAASDVTAGSSGSAHGSNTLQQLDAIELYTNNNNVPGKLVKAVRFSYDHSLCTGLPNSTGGVGKLTLRRVWFEYDGVVPARISPYIFNYTYNDPINYPAPYTSTLTTGFSEYNTIIGTPNAQNPTYTVTAVDAWGNYQENGASRLGEMKKHLNQNPSATFDPAAWQLKSIILPSGGQIDVEYEQDDYQYVQNRRAMALVTLSSANSDESSSTGTYALNVGADLGYTTTTDKQALVNVINNELANDKIYFKFLYTLIGSASPGLGQCNSDYVSGYVNFNSAGLDASGSVTVSIGGGGTYDLPRHICKDLVHKEKGGKLNTAGNCDPAQGIQDGNSPVDILMKLVDKIGTSFVPGNICMTIDPAHSYLRIPLSKAKKGGGLRVKRVLMYDANGIDNGVPAVYGTEYIYQNENGESSGVATNEPSPIREENPLVTFLPKRRDQSFINKAISGTDREQFEGPLGESILPGPSVGYSRVVSKNIHSGKTNVGYVVSEFYTCKDYPFDMSYGQPNLVGSGVQYTDINSDTYKKDWINIPAVYVNYAVSNIWVAQGYRFIKNSMHGQPKSVSTYAGSYQSGSLAMVSKSSATEYEYFQPGEPVPMMAADGSTLTATPGKEMEVAFEARSVEDVTEDGSTSFDMTIGIIPPVVYLPEFSGSGSLNYSETKMRTHVTSKVISYPAIQKSVTTIQEGITHKSENLFFSTYTGKPLVTRTSDGFDGLSLPSDPTHNGKYTSYTIPGYMQYRELGQKAATERKKITPDATVGYSLQVSGPNYAITATLTGTNGASACDALNAATVGDLIAVNTSSGTYYFHVDGIASGKLTLLPSGNYNSGLPTATIGINYYEILRSGRTNQLNTNVGNYTVYGVTSSTVTGVNLANAQNFVNSLNSSLNTAMSNTTIPNSQSFTGVDGYQIKLNGACTNAYTVTITKTAATQFTMSITDGTRACNSSNGFLTTPGQFVLDNNTGTISYVATSTPCVPYAISCFASCSNAGSATVISNVVASSASTMNHYWLYDTLKYDLYKINRGKNDYETGIKGKWRVSSSYVYKEVIVGGAKPAERIYAAAGTYTMTQFNWKNPALNDTTRWVRTSTVTKYSPNGDAIEEKDAIGIYSAAKFGYNYAMPYVIAKNCDYGSVQFEGFEKSYSALGNTFAEDGLVIGASYLGSSYAHSGSASYSLTTNTFSLNTGTLTQQLIDNGASLKVWVKDPQHAALPVKCTLSDGSYSFNNAVPFVKIAQTGEWTLYEAKLTNWYSITLGSSYNIKIGNNIAAQPAILIDDIRLQPLNAQVNAYVYDPKTLRLLASFDDQHFGLYYQYNQEGKLIRKQVETERGIKTITETLYSTPTTTRQ